MARMDIRIDNEKIKQRREELGMTQEDAARRAGLPSKQAWYNVESGVKKRIAAETLYRVAVALSVRMEDLVIAEEPKARKGKGS
jgi:transcriptional regulator with XRE-family HTH domain